MERVISIQRARNKAKKYILEHSPPCTPFSLLQNGNQMTPEQRDSLRRKRAWGTKVLRNVLSVLTYAMGLGCEVSFEHPASATSSEGLPGAGRLPGTDVRGDHPRVRVGTAR